MSQSGVAGVLPVDVGLQLPHLAIQPAQQRKEWFLPGAKSRKRHYMVHWGDGVEQTRTVRWRLLRMHYRGHYSHELSSILGCEMRRILEICKLSLSEILIHLLLDVNKLSVYVIRSEPTVSNTFKTMLITKWWWLFVWVLVGSAQRRKKQCSLARQTCAYTSPCCRLTFCHDGDQSLILFSLLFLFLFFSLLLFSIFCFLF